jgi:hypothetical protein
MCFGGKSSPPPPQPAAPPAPAPAPAEPAPTETELTAAREGKDLDAFGAGGPTTRVDRSAQGGVEGGGSGLNM